MSMTPEAVCPICDGPGDFLGQIGQRQSFRCRNCGAPFSDTVEPDDALPEGVHLLTLGDPSAVHNAIAKAVGEPPMWIDPKDLADAYVKVAQADHYLVCVANCSLDDLDAAEQILIGRSNVTDDPVLELALDILEDNRKELMLKNSRGVR